MKGNHNSRSPLILPSLFVLISTAVFCYFFFSPWRSDIDMVYLNSRSSVAGKSECDLFSGDWIPQEKGAPYSNETKCEIDDRQNCLKNGRPDTDFLKWRWKPSQCELPMFDATEFLELVRGKTMAFVGDSLARNQLQSLLCLLATAVDFMKPADEQYFTKTRVWFYPEYNFTLTFHWSIHLVRSEEGDLNLDPPSMNIYLDEVDDYWPARVEKSDFVIISSGQWFLRTSMYYNDSKVIGCYLCNKENVTELGVHYGYRMAFRTAFRTMMNLKNFNGITFLRTFTGSHYEGGWWNDGGRCNRTRPVPKSEMKLSDYFAELYTNQVAELKAAESEGWKLRELKFRVLEITEMMRVRPDGHPSKYGQPAGTNVERQDCAHWCLPGPVDTWNQLLLQMLKMETKNPGLR